MLVRGRTKHGRKKVGRVVVVVGCGGQENISGYGREANVGGKPKMVKIGA